MGISCKYTHSESSIAPDLALLVCQVQQEDVHETGETYSLQAHGIQQLEVRNSVVVGVAVGGIVSAVMIGRYRGCGSW